jgi:hypothetical protein
MRRCLYPNGVKKPAGILRAVVAPEDKDLESQIRLRVQERNNSPME